MLEEEMLEYLGYNKSERSSKGMDYRNGYKNKQITSNFGKLSIEVPQDIESSYEPKVVKKHQKDISTIDNKIISLYSKGLITTQISEIIDDIYGF